MKSLYSFTMTSLVLLLLGCMAYVSAKPTDDQYPEYTFVKTFEECFDAYNKTEESAQSLPAEERDCLIKICLFRYMKIINEDKSFNADELLKVIRKDGSEAKVHNVVNDCSSKPDATLQESCEALSCFYNILPETEFVGEEDDI